MEKIIENKTCKNCQIEFSITDKDWEFYEKVSPVFNWKKYQIPTPNLCPECRQQRRLSFRNERSLYKRICDATGKPVVSMYAPNTPYKVYDQETWWSDKWDPIMHGRDYDESRSFFQQYNELFQEVPLPSIINSNSINSEYTNYTANNKNCYLIFSNSYGWNEDCFYGTWLSKSTDCADVIHLIDSQDCYEAIDCKSCNNLKYSSYCEWCSHSYFLENCINCTDCIWCKNLRNAQYHIFNKKYSQEEYQKKLQELDLWKSQNLEKFKKEYKAFAAKQPNLFSRQHLCEESSWDYLFDNKNCQDCYDTNASEDCKYLQYSVSDDRDVYDSSYLVDSNLCYENLSLVNGQKSSFCNAVWFWVYNLLYSSFCFNNSSNLFWCIWLKNKQYCILNKQYTKEEYESLVPKIIEKMKEDSEWWEFFPSSMSPFGYNETVANEYFPLSKQEALEKWFNWSDYEAPFPKVEKIIPASKLSENISDIPDDILNWAIECEITKKPFRIIKPELEFYRKHSLPIPKRHPDQRHLDRMNLRNPRKLYERNCDKCDKDIQTTYAPERKETIYCEECYNQEIY